MRDRNREQSRPARIELTVRTLTAAITITTLAACAEERTVSVKGGLIGLPGATHNYGADVQTSRSQGKSIEQALATHAPLAGQELTEVENEPLRYTDDEGNITLVSRTPRHLLFHLIRTIENGEDQLLFDQVLSAQTKGDYTNAGKDPWDAVEYIKRHERDIRRLVQVMPLGEQTPGLILRPIGPNRFRLSATPASSTDLRFRHVEFAVEQGHFRLLIIK